MKKILLSSLSVFFISAVSMAQLTIYEDGQTTDISGQAFTINLTSETSLGLGNNHMVDFLILNQSGTDQDWYVTRQLITAPASWQDYFCWGENGSTGDCYPPTSAASYQSGIKTISNGGEGRLSTYVNSDSGGTGLYRYYISNDGINWIDSVDLEVNSTLSVEEAPSLSVNISPNPASDVININADGVSPANVRIVDVLGNVVYNEAIYTNERVNVSKFKNGIYFVKISAEGVKPVTRKVIVRH